MPISRFLSKKTGRNNRSLSFLVTRCYSWPLVVPLVVTCCTTRCHSLSLVIPVVGTRCHSLSLDVSLVCLFINDPLTSSFLSYWKKVQASWTFFESRESSNSMWPCARTDTAYAQRSYLTVMWLTFAKWRSALTLEVCVKLKDELRNETAAEDDFQNIKETKLWNFQRRPY